MKKFDLEVMLTPVNKRQLLAVTSTGRCNTLPL